VGATSDKTGCANGDKGFVTDTPLSSALREIRAHLSSPVVVAALAGTSVILVLSGPFRTLDRMEPIPRAAYWGTVVFGTYAIGTVVSTLLYRWPRLDKLHPVLRVATASPVMGLAVAVLLVALDFGIGHAPPPDLVSLAWLVALATVISAAVVIPQELRAARQPVAALPEATGNRPPAILARLPVDRRGPLLALSAEDHYVRVITKAGETLVLIRLGDAMGETGDVPGLQVHRSHWVARGAVRAVRRLGDGAVITLETGQDVPVSRRFVPALRQAGLLPNRTGDGNAGVDHL
jgi:hypothetical protein